MSISWNSVKKAASKVEDAPRWRANLAKAIANASGAPMALVYTCPPGEILEGAHAAYPPEKDEVVQRIAREVLPRMAWTRHGVRNPKASRGMAYFPFEDPSGPSLRSLLDTVVAPLGIDEMLHASFLVEGAIVGGMVLWFTTKEVAAKCVEPLTEIARTAGKTLESAIGLAKGCGVQVDYEPILPLELLSSREIQIARLAALGMTDVNISEHLTISEQTVGAHLRRIFLKLRINSRLQLVQDSRLRRPLAT